MDKPQFTFIINASLSGALADGVEFFNQEFGDRIAVRVFSSHDIEEEAISAQTVRGALEQADMVFLDIRGGGKTLGIASSVLSRTKNPVALLVGGSPEAMSMVRLGSFSMKSILENHRKPATGKAGSSINIRSAQRIMKLIETGGSLLPVGKLRHAKNWAKIMRYWGNGGGENIKNLMVLSGREYAGLKLPKPPPPRVYPDYGLYDPLSSRYFDNIEEYMAQSGWAPGRPTVGLLFYGGMHFAQSLVPAAALTRELKTRWRTNILPVFSNAGFNMDAIRTFFLNENQSRVDALAYFQWFSLNTFTDSPEDNAVLLLKKLGVPVFAGTPMFGRDVKQWKQSDQGLSPIEILTTVILPEMDGMIEPIPSCGLEERPCSAIEGLVRVVVPIQDRVERTASRINKWSSLARKPNSKKRVAFLVYDNPPGEDNLGNAAYIDTFASLKTLFGVMKNKGYRILGVPEDQGLHDYFLSRRLVNMARWGGEDIAVLKGQSIGQGAYRDMLASLPAGGDIAGDWGEPLGKIMTWEGRFLLPAVCFGNVLIGLQPARGYHADPDKITHDKTLAPHHQYVAFYRWLEEEWKPDCVVHVGTHGTLEFLKGKETGMSERCFPAALLGDMPHLYFYHVVNASEATIAKRRSLGVLVNYNSPSFTAGGLYDAYESLDQLIAEYMEARTLEPGRAERLKAKIIEKAEIANLPLGSVEEIQEEISMMKRSIIPKGLHILGEDVPQDDRMDFATFFLRYDRGGTPSLHRLLSEKQGFRYEDLLSPSKAKGPVDSHVLESIEANVRSMVESAWSGESLPPKGPERDAVLNAVKIAKKLDGNLETENFLAGLDGKYVEPGLGGDPLRNPEVLPTGRNSFQFDPRLVPSEEACRRGAEIAENTLEHYLRINGKYPESAAVILWGFETTKTRGETVGQILAYLGVRVAPSPNPYFKKLEAIPLEELGRPRIDCLVQICGFFRDMFPNVLSMINRAFSLVSQLDEPEDLNFVRKNTLGTKEDLKNSVAPEMLDRIACGRVFGPRAGEYGTRTTGLIETGAWQSEEEISELFTSTMSHLYAENIHGERHLGAYKQRLSTVDMVSQVRDSHEYEIMDLDHYYEFFGGLSRTVESVKGRAPAMMISDTTKEIIRTETLKESLNRGIRTRLLNPKWIEALLEHDYHGAQKISDRVEYLIGFAATTHAVENWVWSAVAERYISDACMFEKLCTNNKFAAEEIIKRLLEAKKRGYWNASHEEEEMLLERYLELEGKIEEALE